MTPELLTPQPAAAAKPATPDAGAQGSVAIDRGIFPRV
jgi:hypothetical protein